MAYQFSKFAKGDIIGLNDRFPYYPGYPRHKPRKIIRVYYDPVNLCMWYILGSNQTGPCSGEPTDLGLSGHPVRSYQMFMWNKTGKVGKPCVKRKYKLRAPHRFSKASPPGAASTAKSRNRGAPPVIKAGRPLSLNARISYGNCSYPR
ncbi:hypothetical protein LCGC14_0481240 [marine sediment metagenome]|uniref:Uncharacterized protein n=1 Tax=marine sediment metagenome TaxID=412755 RepID=A0A0F9SEP8_9ZZZZ